MFRRSTVIFLALETEVSDILHREPCLPLMLVGSITGLWPPNLGHAHSIPRVEEHWRGHRAEVGPSPSPGNAAPSAGGHGLRGSHRSKSRYLVKPHRSGGAVGLPGGSRPGKSRGSGHDFQHCAVAECPHSELLHPTCGHDTDTGARCVESSLEVEYMEEEE